VTFGENVIVFSRYDLRDFETSLIGDAIDIVSKLSKVSSRITQAHSRYDSNQINAATTAFS
jgi:hypothetical protein